MTVEHVAYAEKKASSVRRLLTAPVPTVDDLKRPKAPPRILGGIVTRLHLGETLVLGNGTRRASVKIESCPSITVIRA
jgi:hypothetical protein